MDIDSKISALEKLFEKSGPAKELWDSLCLQGTPYNTSLWDYLRLEAAKENVTVEHYVRKHKITIEPIRADSIAPFWLAMGITYNRFSKKAKQYHAVVDFREYFGERALFGLIREYIIMATGIRKDTKAAELEMP